QEFVPTDSQSDVVNLMRIQLLQGRQSAAAVANSTKHITVFISSPTAPQNGSSKAKRCAGQSNKTFERIPHWPRRSNGWGRDDKQILRNSMKTPKKINDSYEVLEGVEQPSSQRLPNLLLYLLPNTH